MTGLSTVPAALDDLVAKFSSIEGLNVIDGEPSRGQSGDFVAVGHAQQGAGVVVTESISDYGRASPLETYDVVSQVVAWQGDTDLTACRVRVAAILAQFSPLVLADPTLGGAVMLAQVATTEWLRMQTEQGAMVIAQVTVHVQASKQ